MQVRRLNINNFRGVSSGQVDFQGHTLLVGGNNIGKSTVCESLDLTLGPERLFRRPVIDEHDFHSGHYLSETNEPVEIVIRVLLTDLSEEAERRFHRHLRRWHDPSGQFVDDMDEGPEAADAEGTVWALPIVFVGRYERDEDDFIGNTFFDHPVEQSDEEDPSEQKLGGGRKVFGRDQKRLCGFIFLRTLRTGSRALSLQRGSLLDTVLRLSDNGMSEMWEKTLTELRSLDPAIGEIEQLKEIREEIRKRLARFVNLSAGDEATAFFASDLTRDHLRDVVSLFLAAQPAAHPLPFQKLGTGSVNMLVFALLTFIADLKGQQSVIFAMEEPEIALPPHTQRRVGRFVLSEMGQAIVTSHSPYIIEQFEPDQIVALNRDDAGALSSRNVTLGDIKLKKFRRERRQMAEAILSRAVIVVEGATEAALLPVTSELLERFRGEAYEHIDLSGVSIFNAGSDREVPPFGPFFKTLGKPAFAFYDKQEHEPDEVVAARLADFNQVWESPEKGIEDVLIGEMPVTTLRRFLESAKNRDDYPVNKGTIEDGMSDEDIKRNTRAVLKVRKGDNQPYAALLIAECLTEAELPETIVTILDTVHAFLSHAAATPPQNGDGESEVPKVNAV
ncbi:putative ATP-dependent endonuclease of OLD family [Alkalispirillum mobile]|uniref:Putative ATP-dependent endonuclease of OLD family n=1 Tax=Alkalispirillum mobile TaxID=85925 RepID=A0A498C4W6_9GAMM|nr:AAA family ATPase [Alkalispirillum mobile]RLK50652.1 putative ATP-dependent endonuclease of OLD family [Alkalispirillum mobile]